LEYAGVLEFFEMHPGLAQRKQRTPARTVRRQC